MSSHELLHFTSHEKPGGHVNGAVGSWTVHVMPVQPPLHGHTNASFVAPPPSMDAASLAGDDESRAASTAPSALLLLVEESLPLDASSAAPLKTTSGTASHPTAAIPGINATPISKNARGVDISRRA
jgi:hypothetical protein